MQQCEQKRQDLLQSLQACRSQLLNVDKQSEDFWQVPDCVWGLRPKYEQYQKLCIDAAHFLQRLQRVKDIVQEDSDNMDLLDSVLGALPEAHQEEQDEAFAERNQALNTISSLLADVEAGRIEGVEFFLTAWEQNYNESSVVNSIRRAKQLQFLDFVAREVKKQDPGSSQELLLTLVDSCKEELESSKVKWPSCIKQLVTQYQKFQEEVELTKATCPVNGEGIRKLMDHQADALNWYTAASQLLDSTCSNRSDVDIDRVKQRIGWANYERSVQDFNSKVEACIEQLKRGGVDNACLLAAQTQFEKLQGWTWGTDGKVIFQGTSREKVLKGGRGIMRRLGELCAEDVSRFQQEVGAVMVTPELLKDKKFQCTELTPTMLDWLRDKADNLKGKVVYCFPAHTGVPLPRVGDIIGNLKVMVVDGFSAGMALLVENTNFFQRLRQGGAIVGNIVLSGLKATVAGLGKLLNCGMAVAYAFLIAKVVLLAALLIFLSVGQLDISTFMGYIQDYGLQIVLNMVQLVKQLCMFGSAPYIAVLAVLVLSSKWQKLGKLYEGAKWIVGNLFFKIVVPLITIVCAAQSYILPQVWGQVSNPTLVEVSETGGLRDFVQQILPKVENVLPSASDLFPGTAATETATTFNSSLLETLQNFDLSAAWSMARDTVVDFSSSAANTALEQASALVSMIQSFFNALTGRATEIIVDLTTEKPQVVATTLANIAQSSTDLYNQIAAQVGQLASSLPSSSTEYLNDSSVSSQIIEQAVSGIKQFVGIAPDPPSTAVGLTQMASEFLSQAVKFSFDGAGGQVAKAVAQKGLDVAAMQLAQETLTSITVSIASVTQAITSLGPSFLEPGVIETGMQLPVTGTTAQVGAAALALMAGGGAWLYKVLAKQKQQQEKRPVVRVKAATEPLMTTRQAPLRFATQPSSKTPNFATPGFVTAPTTIDTVPYTPESSFVTALTTIDTVPYTPESSFVTALTTIDTVPYTPESSTVPLPSKLRTTTKTKTLTRLPQPRAATVVPGTAKADFLRGVQTQIFESGCPIPPALQGPVESWDSPAVQAISEEISCVLQSPEVEPVKKAEQISMLETAQTAVACQATGQVVDPVTGRCVGLVTTADTVIVVPASIPSTRLPIAATTTVKVEELKPESLKKYSTIVQSTLSKTQATGLIKVERTFPADHIIRWVPAHLLQAKDKILARQKQQRLIYRQLPRRTRVVQIKPEHFNSKRDTLL